MHSASFIASRNVFPAFRLLGVEDGWWSSVASSWVSELVETSQAHLKQYCYTSSASSPAAKLGTDYSHSQWVFETSLSSVSFWFSHSGALLLSSSQSAPELGEWSLLPWRVPSVKRVQKSQLYDSEAVAFPSGSICVSLVLFFNLIRKVYKCNKLIASLIYWKPSKLN